MSGQQSFPPPRRFQAVPIEETTKKVRRFAPEPVETSTRSSKKDGPAQNSTEGGEEEEKKKENKDEVVTKRRFLPTPVETSFKSSKVAGKPPLPSPELSPNSLSREAPPQLPEAPRPRRKFAPELIETSKRSKKAGDTRPATLPTDKTDLTPGVPNIYTRPKPSASLPGDGSSRLTTQLPPYPPRRQGSMRPHLNTRRSTRQSSFHPDLEDIKSDSDENSDADGRSDSVPSLSGSIGSSEDSLRKLQLARTRESCDDRFSGYLLELAAKAAEKQLREQALAAFPNETFREIVEHFYDREVSDDGSVEGVGMLLDDDTKPTLVVERKATEVGWAVKEMQQHQEHLARLREEETNKKLAAEASKQQDPFWTNGMTTKSAGAPFGKFNCPNAGADKEAELRCMRSAASPPMLGGDLKFRMCPSPKATKFESDQRIDVKPHKVENGGGLWGGYCVAGEAGTYLSPSIDKGPNLIHTPHSEREDPFSSAFASEVPGGKTPNRNRDSGVRMLAGLDERLKAEVTRSKAQDALLDEFDDTFVTQVYNYLSLGYPSLARQYDEELARISRISEDELKSDDARKNAKGYIGIVEGANTTWMPEQTRKSNEELEGYCARWKALRIYILEWARQHPSLSEGGSTPVTWGVRARRGSWAI